MPNYENRFSTPIALTVSRAHFPFLRPSSLNSTVFGTVLTSALCAQLALAPLSALAFVDTGSHWAGQAIDRVSQAGMMSGYPSGDFRPDGLITRAEYAALLAKALRLPTANGGSAPFYDVPSGHWAAPAIATVQREGFINGYPDGSYGPNRTITRAEAMVVLAKAYRLPIPDMASAEQALSSFQDGNQVPNWAKPSVAALIQQGVYRNEPYRTQAIDAITPATRGEMAAFLDALNANNSGMASAPPPATSNPYNNASNNGNMTNSGGLQARVVAVPQNTEFKGKLQGMISSELSKLGDTVQVTLDQPLVSQEGFVAVPPNSQLVGTITTIDPAGRAGKHAALGIDFNTLILPNGERFQIQAAIATEDGLLHGGTTKGRILKAAGVTAIGAGLGAALGTAMGPLSGGKVGKGAIYGTAVGAGSGALAAGAMKGEEVELRPGDGVEIKLRQPLQLSVPVQ